MLTDITIGQFFPGTSALHRMDPRAKLLLLLVLMAAIFVFDTPGGYAVLTVLAVALAVSSGVPLSMYLKSLKPHAGVLPLFAAGAFDPVFVAFNVYDVAAFADGRHGAAFASAESRRRSGA